MLAVAKCSTESQAKNEAAQKLLAKLNPGFTAASITSPVAAPASQAPEPAALIQPDMIAQITQLVAQQVVAQLQASRANTPAPNCFSPGAPPFIATPLAPVIQPPVSQTKVDNHAGPSAPSDSLAQVTNSTQERADESVPVSPSSTSSESREVKSILCANASKSISNVLNAVANVNGKYAQAPSRAASSTERESTLKSNDQKHSNFPRPPVTVPVSRDPAAMVSKSRATYYCGKNYIGTKTLPAILAEAVAESAPLECPASSSTIEEQPMPPQNSAYKPRTFTRPQEGKQFDRSPSRREEALNQVPRQDVKSQPSVHPNNSLKSNTSMQECKENIEPSPEILIEAWDAIYSLLERLRPLENSIEPEKLAIFSWFMRERGFFVTSGSIGSSGSYKSKLSLVFKQNHILSVIGESRTNETHANNVAVTNMIRHLYGPKLYDERRNNGLAMS